MADDKTTGTEVGRENAAKGLKIRIKAAKLDHDLHIALLMKRERLTKADAIVMAYLDGLGGLQDRLDGPSSKP